MGKHACELQPKQIISCAASCAGWSRHRRQLGQREHGLLQSLCLGAAIVQRTLVHTQRELRGLPLHHPCRTHALALIDEAENAPRPRIGDLEQVESINAGPLGQSRFKFSQSRFKLMRVRRERRSGLPMPRHCNTDRGSADGRQHGGFRADGSQQKEREAKARELARSGLPKRLLHCAMTDENARRAHLLSHQADITLADTLRRPIGA